MADNPGKMTSEALDIGLVASDFDAMMAFYGDGLGMQRIEDIELPGIRLTRFEVRTVPERSPPGTPSAVYDAPIDRPLRPGENDLGDLVFGTESLIAAGKGCSGARR